MATMPAVECPICHDKLDDSDTLEDHLLEDHSKRDLAEHIVAEWAAAEQGDELV